MSTVRIVRDAQNEAQVHPHGATLTSWKVDNQELSFVSKNAVYDGKKAIRGGIPIVFPNFGPWDLGPQHGFARTSLWKVAKEPTVESGSAVAAFELEDSEQTRAMWNNRFKLTYTVIVGDHQMETNLDIKNTGDTSFDFTTLLHTYFRVEDVTKTTVDGLKGCKVFDKVHKETRTEDRDLVKISSETDAVYETTSQVHHITGGPNGKTFTVTKKNLPDTVVWNPWAEKAKAMSDFGDDEYPYMICVEAGHVASRCKLDPQQTYSCGQTISIKD
ncbi:uncharacterized protein [Oscarella lobularis]|uniref:uncharacterized protein n=1 Tax=Oscarella lobularis TaxID=121494 RepID=UPI0033136578